MSSDSIENLSTESRTFAPSPAFTAQANGIRPLNGNPHTPNGLSAENSTQQFQRSIAMLPKAMVAASPFILKVNQVTPAQFLMHNY
jgi:hypothetical protein